MYKLIHYQTGLVCYFSSGCLSLELFWYVLVLNISFNLTKAYDDLTKSHDISLF